MNCEDCNNRGWVRSYSYDSVNHPDGYYVQHCGSCNRFKSDQEVREYLKEKEVEENCRCGIDRNGNWSDEVFNRFGCECNPSHHVKGE